MSALAHPTEPTQRLPVLTTDEKTGAYRIDLLSWAGVPMEFTPRALAAFAASLGFLRHPEYHLFQMMRLRGVSIPREPGVMECLAETAWARKVCARALWARRAKERFERQAKAEADALFWRIALESAQ